MKISSDEYYCFRQSFFKENLGKLRFGQAFCNKFNVDNNTLFYTKSTVLADQIICEFYLTDEEVYPTGQVS